ncbi:uncharacterized protein LOC142985169 isoform X2 [Anticarsia gemmatalis]|uniref:uncharacterized protein LOC142985169 isoform X2 n=1 Tax=Anticarsia gemmatalis TaxID=129554 RepID=UPI003F757483
MESSLLNGMCRCCASEGVFKDVKTAYTWMGEEEVYADMLKQCFDICLSTSEQGDDGGICEVCITQLRNAANFKKQVLTTEEQFKKHALSKLFKPSIIKLEVSPEDDNDSDDNALSGDDGYSGPEFEVPIKTEVDDPKPKKRAAASKASTSRAKKAKADNGETSTKRPQAEFVKVETEEYLHNNMSTEENYTDVKDLDKEGEIQNNVLTDGKRSKKTKSRQRSNKKDLSEMSKRQSSIFELLKHRHNIKEIINNSNATPIKKFGDLGYACCYCSENYMEAADLKQHTLVNHLDVTGASFLKKGKDSYVVRLDITDLKCNICNQNIDTLELLTEHLIKNHQKTLYMDIKNHITPFKLPRTEILQCCYCANTFTKFKLLLEHMNNHYRNYICEVCDAGFVANIGLKLHMIAHNTEVYKCDFCSLIFSTLKRKKSHERQTHTLMPALFKCGYCNETFNSYRKKEYHLVAMHAFKVPTAKCQACDKVYKNRRLLNQHVRRDHLMYRTHKCSECDSTFYSASYLKEHMVKHIGLKTFKCDVCPKAFARPNSLKKHVINTHDVSRFKYKCDLCGEPFKQKVSLRRHARICKVPT